MGLLDKLFKRLQREEKSEQESEEENVAFKDIIFDWFNENNDSVEGFIQEFLHPCIDRYKQLEHKKKYFESQPEEAFETNFNSHSILYLAGKYPSNRRFKLLFDYVMDKSNNAYHLKEAIRMWVRRNEFDESTMKFFNVLQAGRINCQLYHAVYDQRDSNISSIVSLPANVMPILRADHRAVFEMVFPYIKEQAFSEKLYVLSGCLAPGQGMEYNDESVMECRAEVNKIIDLQNATDVVPISRELVMDYENAILALPRSEVYASTDSKKRRYLSLKNFPEVKTFLQKHKGNEVAILKFMVYQLGLNYLNRDLKKTYKEIIKEVLKDIKINEQQFCAIVDQKISSNSPMIYNEMLAPIFAQATTEKKSNEELVAHLENKLLRDIENALDLYEYQTIFDAIKLKRDKLSDENAQSLVDAKYNRLYGRLSFQYNWVALTLRDKKHGDFVFEILLGKLNQLFPSSLKSLSKHIQYLQDDHKMATLNLDGVDYDFTVNIFTELNKVLASKKIAYRFVPIVINKRTAYRRDVVEYNCAIELLNYEQFLVYKTKFLASNEMINSSLISDIKYEILDAPMLGVGAVDGLASADDTTFSNDPRWKWFKDDYVDKLESSVKWYDLMDLHIECKGSSKPNKQWAGQITKAVDEFGEERYFKELGSMMSSSLKESFWFLDQYRTTIKGIVWSCALRANEESLSLVKLITEAAYTKIPGIGPKSTALGNVGLNALVLSGSDEAFGMLNLMRNKSKYARFVKAIDKAIDKFLESAPGDPELLADKSIPRFGFEGNGKLVSIDEKVGVQYVIKNMKLSNN